MVRRRFTRILVSYAVALSIPASQTFGASGPAALITPAHAQNVYRHIVESHWIPETGLFLSFPDSTDHKLSQQASVYEQGAVGLLALRLGDTDRAHAIFEFLRNVWSSEPSRPERNGIRGLGNFYNAYFGSGGIEKTIHLGPNAWAGLFAARYANATEDREALQWALDVAYWAIHSLPHNGGAAAMGLRDEPHGAPWAHVFSTENNISYDAMLSELLRSPRLDVSQRATLTQERDGVERWLLRTAFDPAAYRFNRGYNPQGADRLQALDVTTWAVSTLGPRRLADHGIDPNRLMAQAAQAFEVTVQGQLGVDATDQAEADFIFLHLRNAQGRPARPAADHHRLIWYEGMGQYILALATMADYCRQRGGVEAAERYLQKAKRMTEAFDAGAIQDSPGEGAYPYASAGLFFRDGWETQAQSARGPASSLIAATWRCFAGLGWDPLAGHAVASIRPVGVALPKIGDVAHKNPPVLYGNSEQMVIAAWRALERKDLPAAIEQAQATIQEWEPWALKLEDKKAKEVGHFVSYDGDPKQSKVIFNYWALNDVGGAYFILGKAYDAKGDYANAVRAFQQVVNHYPLAQIWDPKGWFWAPAEAIQSDFVQRDPSHYGAINPQA
jgi:tetratricopeptide (TPR) repeat protein